MFMHCYVFARVNIYKKFSIRNEHSFRPSTVSYRRRYCFENRGLCYLHLCFLFAGRYCLLVFLALKNAFGERKHRL